VETELGTYTGFIITLPKALFVWLGNYPETASDDADGIPTGFPYYRLETPAANASCPKPPMLGSIAITACAITTVVSEIVWFFSANSLIWHQQKS
jgi:hypothetical protein